MGLLDRCAHKLRWYPQTAATFLFLQIFLKRAAKPSVGNTSAGFRWVKWPQILLNLIWLCTKASQTFTVKSLPDRHRNPVEPDLALHQSLPDLIRNLPSPEPCWTWLGFAPKPLTPSPEPFSEPYWTWPDSAQKPTRPSPEPSPEPSLEPSPEPR